MSTIVFRCDGGGSVGMGHLSRCKALADVIEKENRTKILWATRDDPAVERILGRPADLLLHGSPSFEALEATEAESVRDFAMSRAAAWVIVDHYGADESYLKALTEGSQGVRSCVLDDHQVIPFDPLLPDRCAGACARKPNRNQTDSHSPIVRMCQYFPYFIAGAAC